MKFAKAAMEEGWPDIHPELRQLLKGFDVFSEANGLPEPVVTDLIREPGSQQGIYLRHFRRLQWALEPGSHHGHIDPEGDGTYRPLTSEELQLAKELRGLEQYQLEQRAGVKFSWHLVRCAADLRSRHYSREQKAQAAAWFRERATRPLWEFLEHDTAGPHFHIGRRDFAWRTRLAVGRRA